MAKTYTVRLFYTSEAQAREVSDIIRELGYMPTIKQIIAMNARMEARDEWQVSILCADRDTCDSISQILQAYHELLAGAMLFVGGDR